MRAFRSSIVVVVLLAGAALVVVPAALSASPSSGRQAPAALGALDQAWQLVGRLAGWFGGARVDEGAGPDPNGKANPAPHAGRHPGRPAADVRPDNGAGPDPNGGAAPHHG